MSTVSEKKKPRTTNYSHQEILTLCQYIGGHRELLFGRAGHCSQKVEQRKQKHWEEAARFIRAAGGAERPWKKLRKKWVDLKVQANKYKSDKSATGGGPCVEFSPIFEAVLNAMAPQARDGITSLGNTETDPLAVSSDSSQEMATIQPTTSSSLPVLLEERPETPQTTTTIPSLFTHWSSQDEKELASVSANLDRRCFEQELLVIERQKVQLARDSLAVQQGILSSLEVISTAMLKED